MRLLLDKYSRIIKSPVFCIIKKQMLKHHYFFVPERQVSLCNVPFDTTSKYGIKVDLLQQFNSKENLGLIL